MEKEQSISPVLVYHKPSSPENDASKIKHVVAALPNLAGVYIMRDNDDKIIYVGKAKNLKARVSSYFNGSAKDNKTLLLATQVADIEYILTINEAEALALECNLVQKNKPFFNILLKDGKRFAFIKIDSSQKYPKLEIVRRVKKDGAKYFGPYFNGIRAKEVLEVAEQSFKIRSCKIDFSKNKKERRACINFDTNRCLGPCVNHIEKEYQKAIEDVTKFLCGNTKTARQKLAEQMAAFSQVEAFEEAIKIKDKLNWLDKLAQRVASIGTKNKDCDAFSFVFDGNLLVVCMAVVRDGNIIDVKCFEADNNSALSKNEAVSSLLSQIYLHSGITVKNIIVDFDGDFELLQTALYEHFETKVKIAKATTKQDKNVIKILKTNANDYLKIAMAKQDKARNAINKLQQALELKQLPNRIECFDISHTGGQDTVASMVVFLNGQKASSQYKRFIIKTVSSIDDYLSLKEVIARRLAHKDWDTPNLIVIDGGKGQLSAVSDIIKKAGIEVCSIAEREEEIFLPNKKESIKLSKDDEALKLLVRLRDETHNFAIKFHRQRRAKNMLIK